MRISLGGLRAGMEGEDLEYFEMKVGIINTYFECSEKSRVFNNYCAMLSQSDTNIKGKINLDLLTVIYMTIVLFSPSYTYYMAVSK